MSDKLKVIHLTHTDLDAAMCDILIRLVYPNANTIKIVPNGILRVINKLNLSDCDILYITDLALREKKIIKSLELKASEGAKITKIIHVDHHQSHKSMELKDWSYVRDSINNRKTCASELLYYKLRQESKINEEHFKCLKSIMGETRIFDTWDDTNKQKLKKAQILNKTFVDKKFDTFVKDIKTRLLNKKPLITDVENLIASKILDEELKYSQESANKVTTFEYKSFKIGLCIAGALHSSIAHNVLDKHSDVDIAVVTDLRKVCLRSREDSTDVSAIARLFGGNGHKKASSFEIKDTSNILSIVSKSIFNI